MKKKKIKKSLKKDKKTFSNLAVLIGISLFLGSALQQVALLYTDVANAAFFTIFYVPMVPIIVFFLHKREIHWSVWPSVILCVIGGYLLTNFYDATERLGDSLVLVGAFFWSTHIIFTGIIIKKFNYPLTIGVIQTFIVGILSLFISLIFEGKKNLNGLAIFTNKLDSINNFELMRTKDNKFLINLSKKGLV